MPRVKRGTGRRDYRRKTLRLAKGYFLTKSKLNRSAQEAVEKALRYGFVGRRRKKRDFRSLWIVRINAACRGAGDFVQQVHQRLEARRHRSEPQGIGGYRYQRRGRVSLPRREGQGCSPDATSVTIAGSNETWKLFTRKASTLSLVSNSASSARLSFWLHFATRIKDLAEQLLAAQDDRDARSAGTR